MEPAAQHLRWRLEVPEGAEAPLEAWLLAQGSTATYREADPPCAFYAYFPPGLRPDPGRLEGFPSIRLLDVESFDDQDWIAKSREGFGCLEVGRRFHIRPTWEDGSGPQGRVSIRVNPGLAFGTGGHETTRLCMGMLESLAEEGKLAEPILDVGSGTGILALAAHLLGAENILAFDLDPDCGPAMAELIADNRDILRHSRPFEAFIGTLEDPRVEAGKPYGTLLANILLVTIRELLPRLGGLAAPGALLVASGILAEQEDEALLTLASGGFTPRAIAREGDWIALLGERGS
ncbi:MAG: 50S ribosomal protein L11 methyltransferase [Acidobacteria bacterium]|nr:50S ribosomal protein L11 methyltransferase [Acidobacteriota bacterium]